MIDHIDGDPLNNTANNLRLCTAQQNQGNSTKRKIGQSIYKGICRITTANKWRAYIAIDRKQAHLGVFDTEEEAALAYNAAAAHFFKEFACLNIIGKGAQRV